MIKTSSIFCASFFCLLIVIFYPFDPFHLFRICLFIFLYPYRLHDFCCCFVSEIFWNRLSCFTIFWVLYRQDVRDTFERTIIFWKIWITALHACNCNILLFCNFHQYVVCILHSWNLSLGRIRRLSFCFQRICRWYFSVLFMRNPHLYILYRRFRPSGHPDYRRLSCLKFIHIDSFTWKHLHKNFQI